MYLNIIFVEHLRVIVSGISWSFLKHWQSANKIVFQPSLKLDTRHQFKRNLIVNYLFAKQLKNGNVNTPK